jgi:hypothetical protein
MARAWHKGWVLFTICRYYSACPSAFGGKDILFRIDVFLSASGAQKNIDSKYLFTAAQPQ